MAIAQTRKTAKPAPRLIVLDMAGTTVAVSDVVPDVWRAAFQRYGLEVPDQAIEGVRGKSKRDAAAELLANCGAGQELVEDIYQAFQSELNDRLSGGVMPLPGVVEAIRELRRLAGQVVLITGFDRATTDRIVKALGWESLVDAVLCADDVDAGRPAPDLILRAMAITKVADAAQVLVAGDTSADLMAAASARAGWIIGVLSGAHTRAQLAMHPHSALLPGIADLPGWLSKRMDANRAE